MKKRKLNYRPVPRYTLRQMESAVASGDLATLRFAAFAFPWHNADWRTAQTLCLHLTNYGDEITRGNAFLGLSYLARFHKRLDKNLAAAALLRGLNDPKNPCETGRRMRSSISITR